MLLKTRKLWLKALPTLLVASAVILLCLIPNKVTAQDYYWVGGTGSWGDLSHWALTSGGTNTPAQLPNATTNVIFDENSFTSTSDTVYIDNLDIMEEYCVCNDLLFEPSAEAMTPTVSGMTPLQIHGTMQLMVFEDLHWLFQGIIELRSSGVETITADETYLNGNIIFLGTGEWTLLDDLFVDANIFLQEGTLNTNNVVVSCDKFFSNIDGERTLNAGASTFYINKGGGNFVWVIENSNKFTFNSGTSTISFTHNLRSRMLAGDGLIYNNIVFTSKTISGDVVAQNCSFNNIDFATSGNIYGGHNVAATTICGGNFTLSGTQNRFEQKISVAGCVDVLNGSNYFHDFYFNRFLLGIPNVMTLQPSSTQTFDGEGLVLVGSHNCTKISIMADSSVSYPPQGHAIIYSDVPMQLSLTALSYLHAKNALDPTGSGVCPDTASLSSDDNCINWDFSYATINIDSTLVKNVHPCSYSKNGELTLYVSDLRYETQYSIDGSNWKTTPFFQNLPSGPVTVQFRQNFNGSFCVMDYTYTTTIGAPPPIEINDIQTTNIVCNGLCDGSLEISATIDNTIPCDTLAIEYSINWGFGNNFQSSNIFENLCAGTYHIMVRDENGCYYGSDGSGSFIPVTIQITQPDALSANTTTKMVSCAGFDDGEISVSPAGGVPPYQHSWSNGETGFEITNLVAGFYSDTIRDQNGCSTIITKEITEPDVLQISFQQGAVSGPPVSYWAEAIISGGTPPYTHHWNDEVVLYGNSTDSNPITQLVSGAYIDSVSDANGCYVVDTVFLDSLSVTAICGDVNCYGNNCGWVGALVHGGDTPYSYSWYSLPDNTFIGNTQTINNLLAGSYYVIVSDVTLKEASDTVTISQPSAPISANAIIDSISCNNQTDGVINLNAAGGTPFQPPTQNYQYVWFKNGVNMGISTSSISILEAAIYSVAITDSLGCVFDTTIILSNPEPLALSHTIGNDDCSTNGFWIDVVVSGGTAPYQYFWNNLGQTTNTISNLSSGDYPITITDHHGCVLKDTFHIVGFESSITHQNVSCFGGNNGWAKVSVDGDFPPYNFSWSPSPILGENSDSIYQISAGKYVVQITDALSCVFEDSINISQPSAPISANAIIDSISCNNQTDGAINLNAAGGTPFHPPTQNYQYVWLKNGIDMGISTSSISILEAAIYSVAITDSLGCVFDTTIILSNPEPLALSHTIGNDNCSINGFWIEVVPNGGTAPYQYFWDDLGQTTNTISNLTGGAFPVTITDYHGCVLQDTFHIVGFESSITYQDASCFGGDNGWAKVSVVGNSPPYSYSWSPSPVLGENSDSIYQLTAGTYVVEITDASFCIFKDSIEISQPEILVYDNIAIQNVTGCFGNANGSIEFAVSGGTPNYQYSIDDGTNWQSSPIFQNLLAGNYTLKIRDTNLCELSYFNNPAIITEPEKLIFESVSSENPLCSSSDDGTITITPAGGTGAICFSIDNGVFWTNSGLLTNLPAGDYYLKIMDENGCITAFQNNPITLVAPDPLGITFNSTNPTCNGCSDGETTANPFGGTPPYQHNWSTSSSSPNITNLSAGIWYVDSVFDANNCLVVDSVILFEPQTLNMILFSENVTCYGENSGSASIIPSGGTRPYSIQWSKKPSPTIISNDSLIENIDAGLYYVLLTDYFGHSIIDSVLITQPDLLTIDFELSTDTICREDSTAWIVANGKWRNSSIFLFLE